MEKHDGLNKDLVSEYKGLLDNLSKEYIDGEIDINTLELKYLKLTNDIAEKYGIAPPHPFTPEYTELDDYGKKEVEKYIGKRFPRPAIQRIIEEDHGTEPGLKSDESLWSFIKEIEGEIKNKENKKSKF